MDELSIDALLTDEELLLLGRITLGLIRIKDASERLNAIADDSDFKLRRLDLVPIALMRNDIVILIAAHERAENAIKSASFASVGVDPSEMSRRAT